MHYINFIIIIFFSSAIFSQNTCKYYCELNGWSTVANSCDLTVPPTFMEPTSLPNDQIYTVLNNDATTTEQLWVDGATDRSINAELPDRGIINHLIVIITYSHVLHGGWIFCLIQLSSLGVI